MNALMVIQIKVAEAQARKALASMRADIAALQKQVVATNAGFAASAGSLRKWGSQVQWAGRQLTYNFSIPLAIAGGAAAKWALDNEAAFKRITKVYGDLSMSQQQVTNETNALRKTFEALSSIYGVQQADVLNLAADWAAAGATGVALAKSVRLTLDTMILGELDAADATKALIAIQAQYGESIDGLSKTIDTLNMIENQTGATMGDLITAMSRSAGVARTSGVDVQHLGAMIAALVPSAGSAANAGNALKTIISRLLAPTKDAADLLGLMGHNVTDVNWMSLNATQRLETLAKSFENLSDAQKAQVSATVASRWQINKFDQLMRDINSTTGYYQRALSATADATANYMQKQKELNTVLSSNPARLKQMWTMLQNALADVIQPLLPWIVYLASELAKLMNTFSSMPPATQKTVLGLLAILAVIGPIGRYIGATATLLAELGSTIKFFAAGPIALLRGAWIAMSAIISGIGTAVGATAGMLSKVATSAAAAPMKLAETGRRIGDAFELGAARADAALASISFGSTAAAGSVAADAAAMAGSFTAASAEIVPVSAAMGTAAGKELVLGASRAIVASGPQLTAVGFAAAQSVNIGFIRAVPITAAAGATSIRTMLAGWAASFANWFRSLGPLLLRGGRAIAGFLTGPIGASITAASLLLMIFWKDIKKAFNSLVAGFRTNQSQITQGWANIVKFFQGIVQAIVRAFYRLPVGIQKAFIAVVNIVKSAAMAVYKLFSYLNPFAHHSPSLVETVTWGMAEIKRQYASVGDVGYIFKKAASDLSAFKTVAASMNFDTWSSQRADVASIAPQNLGNFDALVADWKVLNQLAIAQKNAVNAQTIVTDAWKKKLDEANNSLDVQQAILTQIKNGLDSLTSAYDAHKQAIEDYANTGITGMQAMSDAIFNNQMAQKQLQLQIMNLEDAGGSIQSITDQMNALQGSIESLRGEANDLRASGAGSDILGPIDAQIKQMQDSYDAMGNTVANSPINDLQKQLDALQREGQRLDLQNSLNFDPLTRQIQQAANATKELSFDDIIAGINNERAAMNALQPQIDAAQAAYDAQSAVVDQLTAARDALNVSYQQENAALQALQDEYDTTAQAIRDVESALNDMKAAGVSSASGAGGGGAGGGGAADAFMAAGAGNWPDVGGANSIATPGLPDQTDIIDQMTKELQDELTKNLASLDPTAGLKSFWNKVTTWWNSTMVVGWNQLWGGISATVSSIDFSGFGKTIDGIWQKVLWLWNLLAPLFGPQFAAIWNNFKSAFTDAWDKVGAQLGPLADAFSNLWDQMKQLWTTVWPLIQPVLKVLGALLGASLVLALTQIFKAIAGVIGPVVQWIAGMISVIIQIVRGVINVISGAITYITGMIQMIVAVFRGLFTGDWSGIEGAAQKMWDGLKGMMDGITQIIGAAWSAIWQTISDAAKAVWNVVGGFVSGIVDFFQWLYDVLVGHSIIPDLVNAIIGWFSNLWTSVTGWVRNLVNDISSFFGGIWNNISGFISNLVGNVVSWFASIPGKARDGIGNVVGTLLDKGSDLINGIKNGAASAWYAVSNWFGSIGSSVIGAVGDVTRTLWSAGSNIINGFWNGLKSKWNDVTGWISDIGTWIANHKGPKAYDLGLLVPNGGWIMQGFGTGMKDEFKNVLNDVKAMGPQIAENFQIPTNALNAQLKTASATVAANASAQNSTLVQNSETKVFNFYGNLEFPNVQNGDDAEGFVRNLSDLAGA